MKITFEILDSDLKLDDHQLFMKIWDGYKEKYNYLNSSDLTEEITAFINYKRERLICETCDGAGLIYGNRCIRCRGNGYKS